MANIDTEIQKSLSHLKDGNIRLAKKPIKISLYIINKIDFSIKFEDIWPIYEISKKI